MELWLILILFVAGLGMVIVEAMMPGIVIGLIGAVALITSVVFGFMHHWGIGTAQAVISLVVTPAAFVYGMKKLALKKSLGGEGSFAKTYDDFIGREGEAYTELRPAGMVYIDGKRIDVVTGGELIEKGKRVRVVKVEGNRIVVRAV